MTANKQTVESYLDGFRTSDHRKILSCLTDDIDWEMPGYFHLTGKESFDRDRRGLGSGSTQGRQLPQRGLLRRVPDA